MDSPWCVNVFSFIPDLADLNLPKTCQMDFPDPDDLLNFRLVIMPDEVASWHTLQVGVHFQLTRALDFGIMDVRVAISECFQSYIHVYIW